MTKKLYCPSDTCMFAIDFDCFMGDLKSTNDEYTDNPKNKLCTLYMTRNRFIHQTASSWEFFFAACKAIGITEAIDEDQDLTDNAIAVLERLIDTKISYVIERLQVPQATFYLLSPMALSAMEIQVLRHALEFACKHSPQAI